MDRDVFNPFKGSEASILSTVPIKGGVYFATDTKRIFYSDGESFLPMGGNTGFWYGTMEYAETPDVGQTIFNFSPDEIEGNEDSEEGKYNLPNVDDLIFNNPDGCFYRVIEKDMNIITCKKLTVSGGGGGGGGSGTGSGSMVVSRIGDQIVNTLFGMPCFIKYKFIAKDAADEETGPGQAALYVNGVLRQTYVAMQGENEINVSSYLEIGTNQIRLVVSGNTGGLINESQQKNWSIVATRLDLTWNYNETTINTDEDFEINWSVSSTLPHQAHIVLPVGTIDDEIVTSRERRLIIDREEYNLFHGSYLIGIYITAEIGGQIFTSNTVYHKIIFTNENVGDTIISVGLIADNVDQYNTLSIPIILYDPNSNSGKVSAVLREDGIDKDNWIDYNNATQYYWNYTPTTSGQKILSIISNGKEETLMITVNDLGLLVSEVPGYDFKFKASDLVSNNNLQNWTYGTNIQPTFSEDFDWVNGGLKSELDENSNSRQYVNVKAGSKFSLNYYPLRNVTGEYGFSIKTIFKIVNCRTYDAQGLIIGKKTDNSYIAINANEAIFKTNLSTIKVPYCEDTYVELEFDIWPYGLDGNQAYIMTWLDGVPAGVVTYGYDDTFNNALGEIEIGSNDCDVQLYLIKVYKKHLNFEEHLSNFIIDASNSNDILARYNRNNILDESGEISYSKLIEKNPNAEVYLYEIPRMTTTKKDKVAGCTYKRYKGSTSPLQTADNVEMAVQGTSSAAYGLAAFNFNSTFKSGFTDYSKTAEGEHIDNWAMTENSIPINDFNTKVNVASCEGTNNAINQAWYDKLADLVFKTEYKHKNPQSRHTMEFIGMGVVFIKDSNKITNAENGVNDNVFKDTDGYVNDPYYKMYSICNMGNIKRNEGVFSDPENPYDVIMEVPDNQSVYQQMTGVLTDDGLSLKGRWNGDKFYPIVLEAVYMPTEDSVAQEDKTYYIRTGTEDNYIYTEVQDIVVGTTNVSSYYEYIQAGEYATTEVFEWRDVPEETWDYIKTNRNVDMREQAQDAWTGLVAWFARNNPNAATGQELTNSETYTAYTFKGYTSASGRLDKNGNAMSEYKPSSILKGLTISNYAGTYTHDTYERRMAKMLSECEDHLIMDEIVFHYLFIERHSLIDNVAKNTFWHTEDLQHWSMIKDYDNDTSDGNDNSGHLTLTYGYEVLDKIDHSTSENASYVFNAPTSVWLHFINGLLEARTRMYQALDTSEIKAWDAQPYLDEFNKWQSALPERIWIEDYYRKYLRPKEIYGATQFLPMLEGGKKTHQRKQFETYQEAYMSSEYQGRLCANSIIDIRANGQNIRSKIFPMTMYSDCYIRIAAGSGQDPNVRIRARRGQTYNISLPRDDANDMTTYFYLANYVTSLSGIEQLLPKKVDISQARRLREFSMTTLGAAADSYVLASTQGSYDSSATYYLPNVSEVADPSASDLDKYYIKDGHDYVPTTDSEIDPLKTYYIFAEGENVDRYIEVNSNNEEDFADYFIFVQSSANINLRQASFLSNTMLEKLVLQNCPLISNALDLTGCTSLKYLDIEDSGFTGISLASNAPVETLHLNKPISLTMKNLFKVSDYSCQGYEKLTGLYLDNIDLSPDLNSKDILKDNSLLTCLTNGRLQYNLQNVLWNISDSTELNGQKINLLETLLNQIPSSNDVGHPAFIKDDAYYHALALSGTLTIGASAYNEANSISIYNEYVNTEKYPNINLEFEGNVATLYTVDILDGDGKVAWTKKGNSSNKLKNEFYSDGPNGALSTLISNITTKTNTMAKTFTFTGRWDIYNGSTHVTVTNELPIEENTRVGTNIIITPEFEEHDRYYTVQFFNGEVLLSGADEENKYIYGTRINQILPINIPEKDDSNLDFYETYAFLGWSLSPTGTKALNLTDDYIVNNDLNYYAVFSDIIDPCDSRNVHLSNFNFESTSYTDDYDSTYNINAGYRVVPKPGVLLQGKITIPVKYNNLPVIEISGFTNTSITGIFFEEGTMIRTIEQYCFENNTGLQHVEMPDSLREINNMAFAGARNVKLSRHKQDTTYILGGNNTVSLGPDAFNQCLDVSCRVVVIPASVKYLETHAFSFPASSMALYKVEIGSEDNPSQLQISNNVPLNFNENPVLRSGIIIYLDRNNNVADEEYKQYLSRALGSQSSAEVHVIRI